MSIDVVSFPKDLTTKTLQKNILGLRVTLSNSRESEIEIMIFHRKFPMQRGQRKGNRGNHGRCKGE